MAAEKDREEPAPTEREVEELRDSAKAMGADDVDGMDAEEVVEEVRHTQTDSETSPSGWKAAREEDAEDDGA